MGVQVVCVCVCARGVCICVHVCVFNALNTITRTRVGLIQVFRLETILPGDTPKVGSPPDGQGKAERHLILSINHMPSK